MTQQLEQEQKQAFIEASDPGDGKPCRISNMMHVIMSIVFNEPIDTRDNNGRKGCK